MRRAGIRMPHEIRGDSGAMCVCEHSDDRHAHETGRDCLAPNCDCKAFTAARKCPPLPPLNMREDRTPEQLREDGDVPREESRKSIEQLRAWLPNDPHRDDLLQRAARECADDLERLLADNERLRADLRSKP